MWAFFSELDFGVIVLVTLPLCAARLHHAYYSLESSLRFALKYGVTLF
jgi:hypothetical protein